MDQGPRFKPLAEAEMDEPQRRVYRAIAAGPRGAVRGPFNALLRSPELADRAQKLGEYLRFANSLPAPLNELAILVTARAWSAQYEWYAHAKLAAQAGLGLNLIQEIKNKRRPGKMSGDEAAVYDFCTELHEKKEVSDTAFAAVLERFGERGVVDLIGVSGYYTLVSMVLNVDRVPLPDGQPDPLKKP